VFCQLRAVFHERNASVIQKNVNNVHKDVETVFCIGPVPLPWLTVLFKDHIK